MRTLALVLMLPPILTLAPGPVASEEVLLGRVRPEAILSISDEWRSNRDAYEPAPEDVRRIAALRAPARLDVYFGSWCSDSRRELPRFLKILERASPNRLRVRYYGLDRTKKEPARLARRGSIERVPTFILLVGGREIGRIVETPSATLESDLAALIDRAGEPAP